MAQLCDLKTEENYSATVHSSVLTCIQHLVELNCKRVGSNVVYGQQQKTVKHRQQCLKKKLFDTLFNRQLLQKCKKTSLSWQQISDLSWDTLLVTNAVAYRLRFKHRRCVDADELTRLVDHLLTEGNGVYEPVIQLLLCLAKIDADSSWKTIGGVSLVDRVRRRQDDGEVQNLKMLEHRKVFPMLKYPFVNSNVALLAEPTFSVPRSMNILFEERFAHSSLSEIFDPGLSDDSLFGGLVHCSASLNDKLSLPFLQTIKDIDLCCHLKAKARSTDEDEGFVSCAPSSPSSEKSSKFLAPDLQPLHDSLLEDDEPYIGYRKLNYDISVWRDCLKLSKHRTWETVGKSAGSSKIRWYLSEAGAEMYDAVWKQRWSVTMELASALCPNRGVTPFRSWMMMDERSIVHHARLVAVGVASDTFHYNTLARMFLVTKDIHYKGVTGAATRSLLSSFAEWGTAYRRLLNFSSSCNPSYMERSLKDPGVIFKVLCEGVRTYLQEYQRTLISQRTDDDTSLLGLHCTFKRAGSQISYLCQLCKCGSPSDAVDDANIANFPTRIDILTYLYDEAVYCTETTDYLVLLYLLRQCCQPYLQFVQNWVFHGTCWDVGGEFLLRVSSDKGNGRDRQRWTDYVTVERPNNVASCVPSFLAPVAEDLLRCGKTVEFMSLICPEHFLCTRLVEVPLLLMTFSKTRMRVLQKRWSAFQDTMKGLEEIRRSKWIQKKVDFAKLEIDRVVESHVTYSKQMETARRTNERLVKQLQRTKQVELERLKQQAEDDLKRRKLLRDTERAEDVWRIKENEKKEENFIWKREELLEQEKQTLVDRYELLCDEVSRRREKAKWKLKRHQLNEKRLKLLLQDKDLYNADGYDDIPVKSVDAVAFDNELQAPSTSDDVHNNINISCGPENLIDYVTSPNAPHTFSSSQSTQSSSVTMGTRSHFHPSDESKEVFQGRLLKPGLSQVSDESLPAEARLPSTLTNQHVSQQSSEVLVTKFSRKNVGDKHVSQSSLQFSDQTAVHPVGRNLHKPSLILPPGGDTALINTETTRTFRKAVADRQISRTTLQLTDTRPTLVGNDKADERPSALPLNGNSEPCDDEKSVRTLRRMVGNHHVSDSLLAGIITQDVSCSKADHPSLPNGSKRFAHTSDSTMQDILYGGASQVPAVEKKASVIIPHLTSYPRRSRTCISTLLYPRDEKTDPSLPNAAPEVSHFTLHLPKIGVYDDEVNSLEKAFKVEKRENKNESPKFVDLLGFINDNDVSDEEAQYDVMNLLSSDDDTASIDLHTLPILLRNSVIEPIKQQASLVDRCAIRYFMDDLDLPRHFEALRHFFLLEDGEFARTLSDDLFGMVHSQRRPVEVLNPVSLDSILAHSVQLSTRRSSSMATNLSFQVKFLPPAFNPTDLQVLNCLELRYNVQWPVNVIISESCHNKYNLMLSFLLKLKLVAWALQDIRARLNRIASDRSNVSHLTSSEVRKSHIFRHEMQNFVKVMQGYVSSQVLHVCWQEFNDDLDRNVTTLDQLHLCHAEYINKCILRCLLTPKAQNVMNIITDVLRSILRFRVQLAAPSSASYAALQRTYHEFSRLSNFLYKVVSKLVQRGYQPHLEDFLIRLNYNGFYKS